MSNSPQRKLNQTEFYRLCQYLESRRPELETTLHTRISIATQAEKALSIGISPHTISTALATIKLTLKEGGNSTSGTGSTWRALRSLARAHHSLCNSLGAPCPPDIQLLAKSE